MTRKQRWSNRQKAKKIADLMFYDYSRMLTLVNASKSLKYLVELWVNIYDVDVWVKGKAEWEKSGVCCVCVRTLEPSQRCLLLPYYRLHRNIFPSKWKYYWTWEQRSSSPVTHFWRAVVWCCLVWVWWDVMWNDVMWFNGAYNASI